MDLENKINDTFKLSFYNVLFRFFSIFQYSLNVKVLFIFYTDGNYAKRKTALNGFVYLQLSKPTFKEKSHLKEN